MDDMNMKKTLTKIAFSMFFLGMLFVNASQVFAIEYGGFGGRPAYPRDDNPRSESIFVHTLEPGQVVQEGVRVINNSKEVKTVVVYGADSAKSTDGGFACEQRSDTKDGLGTWLSLDDVTLTLQPGSNQIIPFTITAPVNASVGEHNGCILIQEVKQREDGQVGALISVRTGLRVAVTIPGDIVKGLEIQGLEITKHETKDSFVIHPIVANTGNVSLDTRVSLVTKSLIGRTIAEHGGDFPILRDDVSEWNFELQRPFWGGWYKTKMNVAYDPDPQATVGLRDDSNLSLIAGPSVWFFSFPTIAGAALEILILILIIALVVWIVMSRKRLQWIKNDWVSYTVQDGDTVNNVAQKYGISWKLLVKANDIEPPYSISKGDTLRVPPTQ